MKETLKISFKHWATCADRIDTCIICELLSLWILVRLQLVYILVQNEAKYQVGAQAANKTCDPCFLPNDNDSCFRESAYPFGRTVIVRLDRWDVGFSYLRMPAMWQCGQHTPITDQPWFHVAVATPMTAIAAPRGQRIELCGRHPGSQHDREIPTRLACIQLTIRNVIVLDTMT